MDTAGPHPQHPQRTTPSGQTLPAPHPDTTTAAPPTLQGDQALRPTLRLLAAAGYDLQALRTAARAHTAEHATVHQLRPAAGAEQ